MSDGLFELPEELALFRDENILASYGFTFLFALEGVPNDTLDTARLDNLVGRLVILNRSTANRMSDMLRLDPLDGKRVSGHDTANYRAYRIGETFAVGR